MTSDFKERLFRFLSDVAMNSFRINNPDGADYCFFCQAPFDKNVFVIHADHCDTVTAMQLLLDLEEQSQ